MQEIKDKIGRRPYSAPCFSMYNLCLRSQLMGGSNLRSYSIEAYDYDNDDSDNWE